MSQLVCPLCSESLESEGSHFYKHFKYKRYACGDNSCESEFYTEVERNAHCTKNGHKRSFQKTVNPYIDKMIAMVVEDARELASKDMDSVLEQRWGPGSQQEKISSKVKKGQEDKTKKKRKEAESATTTTTTPATKKARASTGSMPATSPFAFLNNPRTASSSESPTSPAAVDPPGSSSSALPASSNSSTLAIVDSTTNDNVFDKPLQPAPKKPRKKRVSEAATPVKTANTTYAEMSAVEKLIGWYDPNIPERRDALKIKCDVCNEDVVYDYIIRRSHVTHQHMAADIDEKDYLDVLTVAMNKSFPLLANTNLACQLCVTGPDIRKASRREHIEKSHTTSLPPLMCPVDKCGVGFRRQCDLSTHMKEQHKKGMSTYKDSDFQLIRRRRNVRINEMIKKCFPWSELEAIENKASAAMEKDKSANIRPIDFNFDNDVRVREFQIDRTRRAPQYNTNGSSSSSDSEDENASNAASDTGVVADFEQDVIFIKEHFNTELSQKLSQRGATPSIQIKPEVVDVEDVVPPEAQKQIQEEAAEEVKMEEADEPVSGGPPNVQTSPVPTDSILHIYEPIVPPSPSLSSNPIVGVSLADSYSAILNPYSRRIRSPDRDEKKDDDRKERSLSRPPSRDSTYHRPSSRNRIRYPSPYRRPPSSSYSRYTRGGGYNHNHGPSTSSRYTSSSSQYSNNHRNRFDTNNPSEPTRRQIYDNNAARQSSSSNPSYHSSRSNYNNNRSSRY